MKKFFNNQNRWISEAIVFSNPDSVYQVYHKEGGDAFL